MPPILHELRTNKTPPTFHRTNKFTEGFQTIMDSYGIATYQEVNPGLFAVVTFPFLFAVMFGDIGHGLLTTMFALGMIMFERKLARVDLGEVCEISFPKFVPIAYQIARLWGCSSCKSHPGSDLAFGVPTCFPIAVAISSSSWAPSLSTPDSFITTSSPSRFIYSIPAGTSRSTELLALSMATLIPSAWILAGTEPRMP